MSAEATQVTKITIVDSNPESERIVCPSCNGINCTGGYIVHGCFYYCWDCGTGVKTDSFHNITGIQK